MNSQSRHGKRTLRQWVYPINQRPDGRWYEDDRTIDEFFAGLHDDQQPSTWLLSACYRQIRAGDRVWVYQGLPRQVIVAVGFAWSDPWFDSNDYAWRVAIRWDVPTTQMLQQSPAPARATDTNSMLLHYPQRVRELTAEEQERLQLFLFGQAAPEPGPLPEGRRRMLAEITQRQGQGALRQRLLEAYGGRCAISGCTVDAVLQAAHIRRYDGPATNTLANGLLLRADLHDLFDADLLWIDDDYVVRVADTITDTTYRSFDGQCLRLPAVHDHRPDIQALRDHRREVNGTNQATVQ